MRFIFLLQHNLALMITFSWRGIAGVAFINSLRLNYFIWIFSLHKKQDLMKIPIDLK
jgi:hypothetical protein